MYDSAFDSSRFTVFPQTGPLPLLLSLFDANVTRGLGTNNPTRQIEASLGLFKLRSPVDSH